MNPLKQVLLFSCASICVVSCNAPQEERFNPTPIIRKVSTIRKIKSVSTPPVGKGAYYSTLGSDGVYYSAEDGIHKLDHSGEDRLLVTSQMMPESGHSSWVPKLIKTPTGLLASIDHNFETLNCSEIQENGSVGQPFRINPDKVYYDAPGTQEVLGPDTVRVLETVFVPKTGHQFRLTKPRETLKHAIQVGDTVLALVEWSDYLDHREIRFSQFDLDGHALRSYTVRELLHLSKLEKDSIGPSDSVSFFNRLSPETVGFWFYFSNFKEKSTLYYIALTPGQSGDLDTRIVGTMQELNGKPVMGLFQSPAYLGGMHFAMPDFGSVSFITLDQGKAIVHDTVLYNPRRTNALQVKSMGDGGAAWIEQSLTDSSFRLELYNADGSPRLSTPLEIVPDGDEYVYNLYPYHAYEISSSFLHFPHQHHFDVFEIENQ